MKPILFSTAMVKAIIDGEKTCTRRIIKKEIPGGYKPLGFVLYPTNDTEFGNNFRPCEHDISELLNKADKEVLDKELSSKEVKEELRECFEVLKNEKITVEYIKFLGKVCTYYGYTLNDLERKLIKNGKDKFRMGL